jgi:CheY-like chemotaxis protein
MRSPARTALLEGRHEPRPQVRRLCRADGARHRLGIPPDILEQVMEPFFTTKDVGKGTGLGLSMVYGFAKQSGGAIRIDSEVGQGTRVEIWLPRAPAVGGTAASSNEAVEDKGPGPAKALRILLVDDHDGVRATTAAMLEDLGHTVTQSSDGPRCSRSWRRSRAGDLIITDYAMPLVSGTDVIVRARKMVPAMPAIIITGYADVQSIARRPENVQVLAKPFSAEQLRAAITFAITARTKPLEKVRQAG